VSEPDSKETDQGATLAFMDQSVRRGAAKRIDTHASIVFLEGDRVLKIKRAVRLPFLDYSTLERRKHACEAELAVNRRHAPKLYRRIVPITRGSGGLEVDGSGPAIEWAVEMARFDESKTLDHLARAGAIEPALAESIADVLHASHARADISDGSTWLPSIARIIDRNTEKFHSRPSLAGEAVARLHELSHRRLAGTLPLLRQRAAKGLVRHCHADAHLGNIVLIEGRPVLFDAIEFDPAIATTDVLYDLAFPIMDLIYFDLTAAANRLFNRYLQTAWDECADALILLPLFLSIRAAIRSHVLFTKCEQGPDDESAAQAKCYFDLALRLLEFARPALIAIGGKSGTGKSMLARDVAGLIAPLPGAVILRSDVIRKQLLGVEPLVKLPESAYGADVTARVYNTMLERADAIVSQGFSVIVDAAFLHEAERDELASEARKMAADFRPLFLDADLTVRLKRVGSRQNDASDANRDVATLQESYDLGRLDWPVVDASGTPVQTLQRSLALLLPG
jgi:aminoglycoside phosphotransferase family enzyme/predicted kinase